jgi:hypothetical protein
LEDFGNESQHGSSLCSSFDGSDMYYSSNVQSHSEMSSNRSTPLGFEQSLWAHPDSVTHVEGISFEMLLESKEQVDQTYRVSG